MYTYPQHESPAHSSPYGPATGPSPSPPVGLRTQLSQAIALETHARKQQKATANGAATATTSAQNGDHPGSGDEDDDGDAEAGADDDNEQDVDEELDKTPPEGMFYLPPPPARTHPSYEVCLKVMHDWNKAHGYDVSKQKPMKNKNGDNYKFLYRCTRHGRRDNNHKITEETRKRKRASKKTGCPMGLYIRAVEPQNAGGKWRISYQRERRSLFHNHEGLDPEDLTGHRRRNRTEEMKEMIKQTRAAGMDAMQALAYIKEKIPGALITKQDVLNYRRQDPGPSHDSHNYLDRPYILVLSLEVDFENDTTYGQGLLAKLRTKQPVSVCTRVESFSEHLKKNPPRTILVPDSALTMPTYRLQLARLVTYNQDGGTVIFLGGFAKTSPEYMNNMFLQHYNLEWEATGDLATPNQYKLNDKLEAGGTGGRWTVVARNFAPGTDAQGIEQLVGLSPNASLSSCRLYSLHPIVVAELVFSTQEGAESVINTFSGKQVNIGMIATAEGKELEFSLRSPAPMGTSDLISSCFVKANALAKVANEAVVYESVYQDPHIYGNGNWPSQYAVQNQSPQLAAAAYVKLGRGYLGYVGQIDYDENYLKLVAAMCHF